MARIAVDFDGVLYLGPASFGADLAACDPDPYTWAALDTLTHEDYTARVQHLLSAATVETEWQTGPWVVIVTA